jgi:pimeloyl-ACP methyl ester carboxylesterase
LVALRLAATYPELVAHLVLISTPIVPSRSQISRQRRIARVTPAAMFGTLGKEHVLAALDALMEADLGLDLARLTTPTLAIAAENDPLGRPSADVLAADAHAQTVFLPGADPNLLKAAPARLAQLIADFCADFLDNPVN